MVGLCFFSSRRRHTRWPRDWSSDVCSSDLIEPLATRGCRKKKEGPGLLRGLPSIQRDRSYSPRWTLLTVQSPASSAMTNGVAPTCHVGCAATNAAQFGSPLTGPPVSPFAVSVVPSKQRSGFGVGVGAGVGRADGNGVLPGVGDGVGTVTLPTAFTVASW